MSILTTAKAKLTTVNVLNVVVDHSINPLRFIPGENVNGQTVNGNLDLGSMRRDLDSAFDVWRSECKTIETKNKEEGLSLPLPAPRAILEPIWVNKVGKTLTVFRGIRRTSGAQTRAQMSDCPAAMLKAFENTPAYVFEDLTRAQMIEAANDQTTKKYQTSGIIRWVWAMADEGKGIAEIAPIIWNQLGDWASKKMKLAIAKVNAMPDGKEKDDAARDALRGLIDCECLYAHRLGKRVMDAYIHAYLVMDGLIDPKSVPEFKVDRALLGNLIKAADADKAGEGFDKIDGGAAFNALIDAQIDKPVKEKKKSTRPTADKVDEQLGKLQSKVGQEIAVYVKDGTVNGLIKTDELFFHRDKAAKRFLEGAAKFDKTKAVTAEQMFELANALATGNYELVAKINSAMSIA